MAFRSVLQNHGFRNLWISQAVSHIGDSIHEIALIWIVYNLTGDPLLISITILASLLPTLLFSVPAGGLIDMWNRKYVLIAMDLIRAISVLAIPFYANSQYLSSIVVGVALVSGTAQAFVEPAKNALIPELVDENELTSANSLFELSQSLSRILYGVGGGVVLLVGVYSAFYIDAATFLISAIVLFTIPHAAGERAHSESADGNTITRIREGFAFIRSNKFLPSLLLFSMLTGFALGPIGVILPSFTDRWLNAGSFGFGLLYSAIYLGIFVGSIVVGNFKQIASRHRGIALLFGTVSIGATLIAASIVPRYVSQSMSFTGALLALCGFSVAAVQIPLRSLTQRIVPNEMRARVFGFWSSAALVAPPVSIAAAGPLVSYFGPASVLAGEGSLIFCSAIFLLLTPLIQIRATSTQPELEM